MKIKLRIMILIFIFLALQERYVTVARRVKRVTDNLVTAEKEMEDSGYFSSQKESLAVERIRGKIGGRKMRKKVSSSSHNNSVGKRKGDDLMAFASDYHPPKPHPPKNN